MTNTQKELLTATSSPGHHFNNLVSSLWPGMQETRDMHISRKDDIYIAEFVNLIPDELAELNSAMDYLVLWRKFYLRKWSHTHDFVDEALIYRSEWKADGLTQLATLALKICLEPKPVLGEK